MELFYIITSIAAIVVLILALTFIGIMITNGNKKQTFPPNIEQCPDKWIPDGSFCYFNNVNNGDYTVNSNMLEFTTDNKSPYFFTSGGKTAINPFDSKWTSNGLTSTCNQKSWANIHGIQWSGISQSNTC